MRRIEKEDLPERENDLFEFKLEWTERAKQTLLAFANSLGGEIWFGVSDSGEALGLTSEKEDQIRRAIALFARHGAHPEISSLIRIENIACGGKSLLKVRIEPGNKAPYSLSASELNSKTVFVRVGSSNLGATREEIGKLFQRSNPTPWEEREAPNQKLTFSQAADIFGSYGKAFSRDFFQVLNIMNPKGKFTNLGFLLSDQNASILNVGQINGKNELIEKRVFSGSLLKQMAEARSYLEALDIPSIKKDGWDRTETFPFPLKALREGLTNSLAHKDYSEAVNTTVNVYPDAIEFISYGGLPADLTLENAMLLGVSSLRNPKLAGIFCRLGWMEQFGSGFTDMFNSYAGTGLKPSVSSPPKLLIIRLPKLNFSDFSSAEKDLLSLMKDGKAYSRRELEKISSRSRSTIGRILKALTESGEVLASGETKARRYQKRPSYR